jgi:hypothetical protein
MNEDTLCHERSHVYLSARELYRAVAELARGSHPSLAGPLRRQAMRVLQHAAVAGSTLTLGLRATAVTYSRLSLTKVAAVVEAAAIEGQVGDLLLKRLKCLLGQTSRALELVLAVADQYLSLERETDDPPSLEDSVIVEQGVVPADWPLPTAGPIDLAEPRTAPT